jgi:hypothetical protein
MNTKWVTPELLVLQSGQEAQSTKTQWFIEGTPGDSCELPGEGCPGDGGDLQGPS